jgi:Xaa-Pro aminopeptidase
MVARRPLQEGDIINIDVTVYLNGYHGDTSRTFYVGKPSPNAQRLVEATEEALRQAIKASLAHGTCSTASQDGMAWAACKLEWHAMGAGLVVQTESFVA